MNTTKDGQPQIINENRNSHAHVKRGRQNITENRLLRQVNMPEKHGT